MYPQKARNLEGDVETEIRKKKWANQAKCLTGGTRVLTRRGWIPARWVQVGNDVIGSDGAWHAVTAVQTRPRGGDPLVEIKPHCSLPFTVTSDHQVLTTTGWKQAALVTTADWLVIPRPQLEELPFEPLLTLATEQGYEKQIAVDTDFAWICGYWVGDGSAHICGTKMNGRVSFACADTTPEALERLTRFAKSIRVALRTHRPAQRMTHIYFTDAPLARWLNENFRERLPGRDPHVKDSAHSKTMPAFIDSWPDDLAEAFVVGYWTADGTAATARNGEKATTVSPHLAGLLWRQMLARGWPTAVRTQRTSWVYKDEMKTAHTFALERTQTARDIRLNGDVYEVRVQRAAPTSHFLSDIPLYDFTVPTAGNFLAGSILHNCDGVRMLIDGTGDKLRAYNSDGARMDIPRWLDDELATLLRIHAIVDGERMADGMLHLFDLVQCADRIKPSSPWHERQDYLESLVKVWGAPHVRLLRTARTTQAKRALARKIKDGGFEGFMLKDVDAPYEFGPRRSSTWLKVKNVRTIDCVVRSFGEDKHNMQLIVFDADGNEVPIGECSRYEGEAPKAKIGDVIELQVLNMGRPDKPRAYQPHCKRLRPDRDPASCDLEQCDGMWKRAEVPT